MVMAGAGVEEFGSFVLTERREADRQKACPEAERDHQLSSSIVGTFGGEEMNRVDRVDRVEGAPKTIKVK